MASPHSLLVVAQRFHVTDSLSVDLHWLKLGHVLSSDWLDLGLALLTN